MPTCRHFCNKVFIPDKEKVEIAFSKKHKLKLKYVPINKLPKEKKSLKKLLKTVYLEGCKRIYCQKKCDNGTKGKNIQWLKSYTKKRKERLMKQGATSGCRDLIKEFPGYYTL
jgi:hypothetical protein